MATNWATFSEFVAMAINQAVFHLFGAAGRGCSPPPPDNP